MKKLVTADTIQNYVGSHRKVFPVDNNTIVSPAARDLAHTYKIKFVSQEEYEAAIAEEDAKAAAAAAPEPAPAPAEEPEAPAPAPAEEAKPVSVENLTKEQIVEAVIRVLDAKGILDKILK
ncbi:MAG: hypothetical protein PUB39_00210 [Eubacteriales bacterium]|jgi:pyruvate/2-oxoglutarate dehydrogenase complex dihydrolipoamide acyltransferase (E2) component|nr:hypothetical protein [Eubacteriales bacterium]